MQNGVVVELTYDITTASQNYLVYQTKCKKSIIAHVTSMFAVWHIFFHKCNVSANIQFIQCLEQYLYNLLK